MLTLKLTLTDTDLGLTLGDTINFEQDQNVLNLVHDALEEMETRMRLAQSALERKDLHGARG